MKRYIYSLLFLFSVSTLVSQSSGYLGKKVLLGYGFHASPISMGASANNTSLIGGGGSAETGVFTLNMIHEGYLEFAASNRWMINFSVRYYKTAYDNQASIRYTVPDYYGGYGSVYSGKPSGYYTINGLSYTLYCKYFGSRYIAPWGRYVMFGPVLNTVKASYDPTVMNFSSDYYDYNTSTNQKKKMSDFGPREQKFKGFNFMLGWGRSRVLAKRVVLDYGCNFQLLSVLTTVFDVASDDGFTLESKGTNDNYNYIERTNKKRVRGVNKFNVFLKVGILLF